MKSLTTRLSRIGFLALLPTLILFISNQYLFGMAGTITGPTNVCAHSQYVYSISGAYTSYTWGVTGGTGIPNTNSVNVLWGPAGAGTVSVTLVDNVGNVSSQTLNVTIFPVPDATISFPPPPTCPGKGGDHSAGNGKNDPCIKICENTVMTFTAVLAAGNNYQWSQSGGTPLSGSTSNVFIVQWGAAGVANLQLVVSNAGGCKDSTKICFEIISRPIANFTTSNVCFGIAALFNSSTTIGATSYSWNFGDPGSGPANTSTNANPSHIFSSPGTFTVCLIAENDCHCTDTFCAPITVDATPGPPIVCPATVCQGDTATYSTPAMCSTYTWTVSANGSIISGAGTNTITVVWNTGPIGTVSLLVGGCTPSGYCTTPTVVNIPIIPPTLTISGSTTPCSNSTECYTIPFFDGTIANWSISPSVPFTQEGCNKICVTWPFVTTPPTTYTITVNYQNSFLGCSGIASLTVTVLPELIVSGPPKACNASPASYTAFGIGPVNCNWTISPSGPSFTGNGTSTINVNWNGGTGFYTITATPISAGVVCNSSASIITEVVASPPAPTITGPSPVCPNSVQTYIASTGSNLTWSVVNGTLASTSGNPVNVTWGASGPYSISVFQTDPITNCQSTTTTLNVTSFLPIVTPVITGPGTSCPEGTSSYTCTSYPPGVTLTWAISPANFGTITSGQGTTGITIQWANVPGQTASITVSASVCNQTVTSAPKVVTISTLPSATVTQSGTACPGTSVTLSVPSCGGCTYLWTNPNNATFTTSSISTAIPGLYSVVVTNSSGCSSSSHYNLITLPAPSAIVNPTTINICPPNPISATFYAQTGVGWTYLWTPGNATTSTFTATAIGTYTLTVTNSYGCTASTTVTVTNNTCTGSGCSPNPNFIVNFNISQPTPNCNTVTFTSTATAGSTNPTWDFGDLTSGTGNSIAHTYTVAGVYFVTHCVKVPNINPPPNKCQICTTKTVIIPVVAKFTANVCGCLPVQFNNLTTLASGNTATYLWNFGDASTSTAVNPTHSYASPGTYTVTLTATANNGCVSTYTLNVVITGINATFTGPTTACKGNPVTFTNTSTNGSGVTYSWNFGDAITSNLINGTHTYATTGTFMVVLTAKDACGCTKTFSQNITITNPSCSGTITASPGTTVCQGNNITLTAPAGGATYFWSNGAVTLVNTLVVNQTGTYSVLIVDANGCKCSIAPINIIVNPAPIAIIYGPLEACVNSCPFLFTSQGTGYTYVWKDQGGNIVSTFYYLSLCPVLIPGTFSYTVMITDANGCTATSLPFTLVVHPNPTVSITASGATTFCQGGSVSLTANPPSGLTYQWNTGQVVSSIVAASNGNYTVTVTDVNGCTASASQFVTVHPKPPLCGFQCGCYTECAPFLIPGPPGGTTYQWQLNGANIPGATTQNYLASVNGSYTVIVGNSFGCQDTTCNLDLTLTSCVHCSELVIDSVYCDSTGNVAFDYHVYNGSGYNIGSWQLNLIPPQSLLVLGDSVNQYVHDGDLSPVHTAEIIGGIPGQQICFSVSIQRIDQYGNHIFCCQSDSVCFMLPECPDNCAKLIIDKVYCSPNGYAIDYQVSNLTNTNMSEWIVSLYPPTPPVTLSSNDVITPLPAMSTSTVHTLFVNGATPGQLLCFAITLQSLDLYGYQNCCCTANQKYCVVMPSCTSPSAPLVIRPNPANDLIMIDNSNTEIPSMIRMFDMMGKKVMEQDVVDGSKGYFQLPIKALMNGTYIVQIVRAHSVSQGIFIKE